MLVKLSEIDMDKNIINREANLQLEDYVSISITFLIKIMKGTNFSGNICRLQFRHEQVIGFKVGEMELSG